MTSTLQLRVLLVGEIDPCTSSTPISNAVIEISDIFRSASQVKLPQLFERGKLDVIPDRSFAVGFHEVTGPCVVELEVHQESGHTDILSEGM